MNDGICVIEMLCVENNVIYVFYLMTFLFDEWMHALMTGEGGASSGSRVRIICKWVAATPRTICLSTNHWPGPPCSKSDNLGVGHGSFQRDDCKLQSAARALCIYSQTRAIRGRRREGVVYNPSLSSSQKDENHISQIVTGGADNLGRWGEGGEVGGGKG